MCVCLTAAPAKFRSTEETTSLLLQVMEKVPEQIQHQQLGALTGFFGERLGDWRCIRPVMAGCLALLRRGLQGEGAAWEHLSAVEVSSS